MKIECNGLTRVEFGGWRWSFIADIPGMERVYFSGIRWPDGLIDWDYVDSLPPDKVEEATRIAGEIMELLADPALVIF